MNAPTHIQTAQSVTAVVTALANRYFNDPKQAMEVLTGGCEFDTSMSSDDLYDLAVQASDHAQDLLDARAMYLTFNGKTVTQWRIDQYLAAEIAFCDLAAARKETEREEQDWLDNQPYHRRRC